MITRERVLELLDYDPETGIFRWRVDRKKVKAGQVAGTITDSGYVRVCLDGILYMAHRLVWFLETGDWPADQLDHRDRNKVNNRFSNLREATDAENRQNMPPRSNKTGLIGAHKGSNSRRWTSSIKVQGKKHHLGYFDTPAEAAAAYVEAKKTYHLFHPEVNLS